MTASDQNKLLKVGFRIIRAENFARAGKQNCSGFIIKAKFRDRNQWFTLEKNFKTAKERDARMVVLLSTSDFGTERTICDNGEKLSIEDSKKIVNAGFKIIRGEINPIVGHTFEYKLLFRKGGAWMSERKNYGSSAALMKRMKELLEDEKIIKD